MKHLSIKWLFLLACIVTATLWLLAKPISALGYEPLLSLAQIAGLLGITALAFNFFLASRFIFLDQLMGGLDKVFKFHRFTGKLAFGLMLAHPLLLITSNIPYWNIVIRFVFPQQGYAAENFGIFALWGFSLLIIATLFVKMPYHIWKQTHRFMGVPFFLVAIHVMTVESDVSVFMPLRYWILALITTSFALYIYKVFLYQFIGPRYKYRVTDVTRKGLVTEITLKPSGRKMNYRPGQFVFLKLNDKNIGKEEHPFSISSSPGDPILRLSIKQSGDYTKRLKNLSKDVDVTVYGPYGRFGEPFLEKEGDSVWIAGGIGVTPFLSLARFNQQQKGTKHVDLYYSTKNQEEMVYQKELQKAADTLPAMSLRPHFSEEEGYLDAKKVADEVNNIETKRIFLCGPPPMMKALLKGFLELGVPRRNIFFEDFSLR